MQRESYLLGKLHWRNGLLFLLIVAGLGWSLYLSTNLRDLSLERSRLEAEFGKLDIKDPGRVYVARVKSDSIELPPGVESGYVWQYRIYLPDEYSRCSVSRTGLVAAEGARSRGGGSSTSSFRGDPEEVIATVALLKVDGEWIFTFTTGGSASTTRLSESDSIESIEDLLIDEPFSIGETQSFSADEAICLARLRLPESKATTDDGVELYPGISFFLMDENSRADFERWARGQINEMPRSEEDAS